MSTNFGFTENIILTSSSLRLEEHACDKKFSTLCRTEWSDNAEVLGTSHSGAAGPAGILFNPHALSTLCHTLSHPTYYSLGRAFERDMNASTRCESTTAHNDKELLLISLHTLNASQYKAPQDRNLADTCQPALRLV